MRKQNVCILAMQDVSVDFQQQWIQQHVQDASQVLKKPVQRLSHTCFPPAMLWSTHAGLSSLHIQLLVFPLAGESSAARASAEKSAVRLPLQLLLEEFGKELNATLNATLPQRNPFAAFWLWKRLIQHKPSLMQLPSSRHMQERHPPEERMQAVPTHVFCLMYGCCRYYGQSCMRLTVTSPLQGEGFWEWFAPGQIAPASEGDGQGLYGIYETDEAFQ